MSNFVCAMPSAALSYPGVREGVTVPLEADTPTPGKDAGKISLWTEIGAGFDSATNSNVCSNEWVKSFPFPDDLIGLKRRQLSTYHRLARPARTRRGCGGS
ncbi:hypothetical protein AB0E67_32955 [Streptomyces sp. NPDC032161]|uniref:hypothetical protein n=1 Tax=unclassified Streptomyces TaxID=2593676 RepID=UPI0033D95B6A